MRSRLYEPALMSTPDREAPVALSPDRIPSSPVPTPRHTSRSRHHRLRHLVTRSEPVITGSDTSSHDPIPSSPAPTPRHTIRSRHHRLRHLVTRSDPVITGSDTSSHDPIPSSPAPTPRHTIRSRHHRLRCQSHGRILVTRSDTSSHDPIPSSPARPGDPSTRAQCAVRAGRVDPAHDGGMTRHAISAAIFAPLGLDPRIGSLKNRARTKSTGPASQNAGASPWHDGWLAEITPGYSGPPGMAVRIGP